jgi:hypothetical protein
MIVEDFESWCDFVDYDVKEFDKEVMEVYSDDYNLGSFKGQYVKNYGKTEELIYDTYTPHTRPDYRIDHDYDPAYAVNAFYDNFMKYGSNTRVPYFSPYDPTYTEYESDAMSSYDFHTMIVKRNHLRPIGSALPLRVKQLNPDVKETYLGFVDNIEDVPVGGVGFVFNPFSLEAKKKILSVEATETGVKGTYQFRSKVYPFNWKYSHGRRILNSDVWRNNWGMRLNEFYCFSMVDRTSSAKRYTNATRSHFAVVPKVVFVKTLHGFDPGLDCKMVETEDYKIAVVPGTTYPMPSSEMSLVEVERKGFVQLEMHQQGNIHFTHIKGGPRVGISGGVATSQRSFAVEGTEKGFRSGGLQGILKANMEKRGSYTDINRGISYIERQVVSDGQEEGAFTRITRESKGDPFVTHGKINNSRRGLFEKFVHVGTQLSFYFNYTDELRYVNMVKVRDKWYLSLFMFNDTICDSLKEKVEKVKVSYINYIGNAICDPVNVVDFFLMWMQLSPDEMLQKTFGGLESNEFSRYDSKVAKVKMKPRKERCDREGHIIDEECELLEQLEL